MKNILVTSTCTVKLGCLFFHCSAQPVCRFPWGWSIRRCMLKVLRDKEVKMWSMSNFSCSSLLLFKWYFYPFSRILLSPTGHQTSHVGLVTFSNWCLSVLCHMTVTVTSPHCLHELVSRISLIHSDALKKMSFIKPLYIYVKLIAQLLHKADSGHYNVYTYMPICQLCFNVKW